MDYAAWKLFIDAADFGSLSKVAVTTALASRTSAARSANWSTSVVVACLNGRVEVSC